MHDTYSDDYSSVAIDDRLIPEGARRLAGAAVFVTLVAGMGLWSYNLGTRDAGEVPVIKAIDGPARIQPEDQFSSDQLVADLRARGADATLLDTADGDVSVAVATVAARAQQGDLIAVLSNGGFGGFIPKLLDRLGAPASDPAPAV